MKKIIVSTAALVLFGFAQADADYVRGYTQRDGTYVAPHQRTSPDRNPYNNYNFPGNYQSKQWQDHTWEPRQLPGPVL